MAKRNYTYRSMRKEREYGPFWYSAVWRLVRPVMVGAASLLIVAGILTAVWQSVYETYLAPAEAGSTEPVAFTVTSGQSLTGVANNLEKAGLVRSRTAFKYYCDFSGFAQKLQSGDYTLTRGMSMKEIAERLTRGDGNPLVRNITLIPGWTIEEFAARLQEAGVVQDTGEFLRLCREGTAFRDFYYVNEMLSGGDAKYRRYALEGYLSPNTYEVYTTASAEEIIRKLLSQTEKSFPADDQDRADELGYTMDEILTLASLIEKEAGAGDFARVSAVFHNRLKQGMPLGSDVTIHYITGVRKMYLTDSDLTVDSPYNTYKYAGLPIGPICNPSADAIAAALWPDETMLAENYLYFCAKEPESGELYFSRTLQEHEQAVAIYAPLWKAYDEERGLH